VGGTLRFVIWALQCFVPECRERSPDAIRKWRAITKLIFVEVIQNTQGAGLVTSGIKNTIKWSFNLLVEKRWLACLAGLLVGPAFECVFQFDKHDEPELSFHDDFSRSPRNDLGIKVLTKRKGACVIPIKNACACGIIDLVRDCTLA